LKFSIENTRYDIDLTKVENNNTFNNITDDEYEESKRKNKILYSLYENEIKLLEKFLIISKILNSELYLMGIFVKCLNDEMRAELNPGNILKILIKFFNSNMKDFVVLVVNRVTFSKMQCETANFGEIDYILKKDLKRVNDLMHFVLNINLEINRILAKKDSEDILEDFKLSLENIVKNSFYFLCN